MSRALRGHGRLTPALAAVALMLSGSTSDLVAQASTRVVPLAEAEQRMPAFQRRVRLHADSARLGDALRAVAASAQLDFVWSASIARTECRVSYHADDVSVSAAVIELLSRCGLGAEVEAVATSASTFVLRRRAEVRHAASTVPPLRVDSAYLRGFVRNQRTGAPVVGALVAIEPVGLQARTDRAGSFGIAGVPIGRWRLRVTALGFQQQDSTIVVVRDTTRVTIELVWRTHVLPWVRVVERGGATAEELRARELFDRTALPGVSSMSRREVTSLPTAVEPDVLRSLQVLPGMMAINDLDAQLYVRGGNADQNLFLLDGAPVYGPYHMFSMGGAFNADAIESVDFYRGHRPPQYGGALSSVVSINQRSGAPRGAEGGLSLLGARLTYTGSAAGDRVRWMTAGRRTLADMAVGGRMPYGFFDGQARVDVEVGPRHAVTASAFVSDDRFNMFFGGDDDDDDLKSRWQNAVASLRWQASFANWSAISTLWTSNYGASLLVGPTDSATRTTDHIRLAGARVDMEGSAGATLVRVGAEVEGGKVVLESTSTSGSYFAGRAADTRIRPAIHAEAERHLGAFRVSAGLRVVAARTPAPFIEPRVSVRAHISDQLALTVGASRDHQIMSALRDERTILPGPPMWFVHPRGSPAARADGVTAELTMWAGRGWQLAATAYRRHFFDVPHWRPEGSRDLASLSFDDGTTTGIELSARHFGDRVSGWIGYSHSRNTVTDAESGAHYRPISDRPHIFSATFVMRAVRRTTLSAEAFVASGTPFWPFVGDWPGPALRGKSEPWSPGFFTWSRPIAHWADEQERMPTYGRLDVGIRSPFTVRGATVEPFLNIQNASARRAVMYYQTAVPEGSTADDPAGEVVLKPIALPWTVLPTFGFNVRF